MVDLDPLLEERRLPHWLARVCKSPATVVLLARSEPVMRLPPAARLEWARVLAPFRLVRAGLETDRSEVVRSEKTEASCLCEWSESTDDERRVLSQIAIDGYASPHPAIEPILEQLAGRGLLRANTLTFADEHLAIFVRRTVTSTDLDRWQAIDGGTAWSMVRVPLATAITAALAILSNLHLDVLATGAVIPAVAAALQPLLRLVGGPSRPG
jgi:hypothetical protein